MNNYRYTGYDKAGASIKGVIEAASPEDAKDKLWKKGLFISTVTQSKGDAVAEEAAAAIWRDIVVAPERTAESIVETTCRRGASA